MEILDKMCSESEARYACLCEGVVDAYFRTYEDAERYMIRFHGGNWWMYDFAIVEV